MTPQDIARFWTKAKVLEGLDACWEWQAGLLGNGYGQFKLNGAPTYAHRIAWELTNGPVPERRNVLHRCDNKLCINPAHLFIGTQKENVADAIEKGRREPIIESRRGEKSNWAKVTEKEVLEIREMGRRGYSQRVIGEKFGISRPAVNLIINRKNWKHI